MTDREKLEKCVAFIRKIERAADFDTVDELREQTQSLKDEAWHILVDVEY